MVSHEPSSDPALDTLLLPLSQRRLSEPGGAVLFLRARLNAALASQALPDLLCEQSFRPDAVALQNAGFAVQPAQVEQSRFDLVMLLPPRQRDEARALMARAVRLLRPGGRVIAACMNSDGARACEGDLAQLTGPVETLCKHKCRAFWSAALTGPADPALCEQWAQLDAVRPIGDGRFVSRPGVFAWDRIDAASALLAANLPADLSGSAADLGCGFGYLAAQLLQRCAAIRVLDVFDAEQRALQLAQLNLARYAPRVALQYHWHDVTGGLPDSYDVIVSNPPFHAQQSAHRPDLGRAFIAAAAAALRAGGSLWLVANRHLPYESALGANFGRVRIVAQHDGFKVIEAIKMPARAQR